jgi:hypothetical protein
MPSRRTDPLPKPNGRSTKPRARRGAFRIRDVSSVAGGHPAGFATDAGAVAQELCKRTLAEFAKRLDLAA